MPHPVESITITELARNLATVIDRVRMSAKRVSITRGTQTVAQLRPAVQPGVTLGGLQDILQRGALSNEERQHYAADLDKVRAAASLPPSPWE